MNFPALHHVGHGGKCNTYICKIPKEIMLISHAFVFFYVSYNDMPHSFSTEKTWYGTEMNESWNFIGAE